MVLLAGDGVGGALSGHHQGDAPEAAALPAGLNTLWKRAMRSGCVSLCPSWDTHVVLLSGLQPPGGSSTCGACGVRPAPTLPFLKLWRGLEAAADEDGDAGAGTDAVCVVLVLMLML